MGFMQDQFVGEVQEWEVEEMGWRSTKKLS
jgi:hypothetical protein